MDFLAMRCQRHPEGPVFWQGSHRPCWDCGHPGERAPTIPDSGHKFRRSTSSDHPYVTRL